MIGEIKKLVAPKLVQIAESSLLEARRLIKVSLEQTPEYYQLIQGQLKRDFGLVDGKQIVENIIDAIQQSVKVELIKPSPSSFGGVFIGIYKDDFSDALSAYETKYESINISGETHLVEWLKWLLFEGDKIIIADFGIFSHARGTGSRTGSTLMIPAVGKKTTPFRVLPQFAGTEKSNWITRAAEITAPLLQDFLEKQAKLLLS